MGDGPLPITVIIAGVEGRLRGEEARGSTIAQVKHDGGGCSGSAAFQMGQGRQDVWRNDLLPKRKTTSWPATFKPTGSSRFDCSAAGTPTVSRSK